MNRSLFATSGAFLLAVTLLTLASARSRPPASPDATGLRILEAASSLFDSLDEKQRRQAFHDYGDKERFNWHFIPKDRKGLPLKELDGNRRGRITALLRAVLSEKGARRAEDVMALEDILREIEGPSRSFARDPLLYYLSFFGKPSREGRWGVRLEGHHLSLNFSLHGERVLSATPAFYGANPAIVREGPRKGLRVLGGLEDLARELVTSLDGDQQKVCLGEEVPLEVPGTGAGRYVGPFPLGLAAEKLPEGGRMKLLNLIREYTSNFPEDLVKGIVPQELKGIHFAWRGGLKPFEPHSYLVHGPDFVINYTNTQNGAAHIHSCLRVLRGEFGLDEAGD